MKLKYCISVILAVFGVPSCCALTTTIERVQNQTPFVIKVCNKEIDKCVKIKPSSNTILKTALPMSWCTSDMMHIDVDGKAVFHFCQGALKWKVKPSFLQGRTYIENAFRKCNAKKSRMYCNDHGKVLEVKSFRFMGLRTDYGLVMKVKGDNRDKLKVGFYLNE